MPNPKPLHRSMNASFVIPAETGIQPFWTLVFAGMTLSAS